MDNSSQRDQHLYQVLALNVQCLNLWKVISSALDAKKTVFVFPELQALSFSEPYLRFTYGGEAFPWSGLDFSSSPNFFGDILPTTEYFDLEPILTKYSRMKSSQSLPLISHWSRTLTETLSRFQELHSVYLRHVHQVSTICQLSGIPHDSYQDFLEDNRMTVEKYSGEDDTEIETEETDAEADMEAYEETTQDSLSSQMKIDLSIHASDSVTRIGFHKKTLHAKQLSLSFTFVTFDQKSLAEIALMSKLVRQMYSFESIVTEREDFAWKFCGKNLRIKYDGKTVRNFSSVSGSPSGCAVGNIGWSSGVHSWSLCLRGDHLLSGE
eukprot:TRINITY_DN2139_c0_g1_i4.p1 TRINITY_DN2139_c0_g1~~TRINITY_DN2139_c0_g1_i4.p1  ORF type:complete len:324 (-),score=57.00 TRINITY_DN2139_c0_g1_i4:366-1337(-)